MGSVPTIRLPDGTAVPVLGQGTWTIADRPARRAAAIAALRAGLDAGLTLIDTAEMYGDGAAEELIGEAIAGRRDEAYLVSKVYPHNAGRRSAIEACERSLRRLGTDRLDLYLLHWRGPIPLAETVAAFERLRETGKIRAWGVSNFDRDDMAELLDEGGAAVAVNQVLYNCLRRGIEFDLLPWQAAKRMPLMAYSPLEIGLLARSAGVQHVAKRHNATAMQIALAFVLRDPHIFTIPKSSNPEHVRQNRAAADIKLGPDDLNDLNHASPPPRKKVPLALA